jgi:hypothetical protein
MITGAEVGGALTTIRALAEAIRTARNSSDPRILKEAIDAAYERLLTAREQVAALQEEKASALGEINALQQKLDNRIEFEKSIPNYQLRRYEPGAFAYTEKGSGGDERNVPRYCQPCFANKELSMLQGTHRIEMRYQIYFCPKCKNNFAMSGVPD